MSLRDELLAISDKAVLEREERLIEQKRKDAKKRLEEEKSRMIARMKGAAAMGEYSVVFEFYEPTSEERGFYSYSIEAFLRKFLEEEGLSYTVLEQAIPASLKRAIRIRW